MVPYSLYIYSIWYLKWTSNDIGNYLGRCNRVLGLWFGAYSICVGFESGVSGEFLASFDVCFVFSNFIQKVCWGLLQPRLVAFCPRLPFRGKSISKKFRKAQICFKVFELVIDCKNIQLDSRRPKKAPFASKRPKNKISKGPTLAPKCSNWIHKAKGQNSFQEADDCPTYPQQILEIVEG